MKKKIPFGYFLVLLIALVAGIVSEILRNEQIRKETNYNNISKQAEKKIQEEEERINRFLTPVEKRYFSSPVFTTTDRDYLNNLLQDINGFTVLAFYEDSLYYWSDNQVILTYEVLSRSGNETAIQAGNGLYEVFIRKDKRKTLVALMLLKSQYAIENQYLVNDFNPRFGLPEN